MEELKMWHLNPNEYGEEWYTTARTKLEALLNIIKFVEAKVNESDYGFQTNNRDLQWLKSIYESDFSKKSMGKYTFDSYGEGKVVRSEIA